MIKELFSNVSYIKQNSYEPITLERVFNKCTGLPKKHAPPKCLKFQAPLAAI